MIHQWYRLSITKQELANGIIGPMIEMDNKYNWTKNHNHAIFKKEDIEHIHYYFQQPVLHYFRSALPRSKVVLCEKPNPKDVVFFRGDEMSKELLNGNPSA